MPLGDDLLVEYAHLLDHQQPHVFHYVSRQLLLGDVLAFYVKPEVLPLPAASAEKSTRSRTSPACPWLVRRPVLTSTSSPLPRWRVSYVVEEVPLSLSTNLVEGVFCEVLSYYTPSWRLVTPSYSKDHAFGGCATPAPRSTLRVVTRPRDRRVKAYGQLPALLLDEGPPPEPRSLPATKLRIPPRVAGVALRQGKE